MENFETNEEFLASVSRMSKDVRQAAQTLSDDEARFLVDSYYAMQESRIREAHRLRIMSAKTAEKAEPHSVIGWLADQNGTLEQQIRGALGRYAQNHPVGVWAMDQVGIGPVIAAGLLAHLDPCYPTVGHIFRFCGLDPSVKWVKGEKRPWSHSAKQVAFKIGDSMVKLSNHPKCLYGAIYRARKEVEVRRNDAGRYAEQAKETLATKKFKDRKVREIYESGKLPDGRIDFRARRVATKLFLSHYHTVAFYHATGKIPAVPYAIAHAGHAHYIAPPNFDAKIFPVADPVREPHSVPLSAAVAKQQGRKVTTITSIEDAAAAVRSVE